MTSHLCVLCGECLTLAINSPCECGKVATKELKEPYECLLVFSNSPENLSLGKAWLNENGILSFFRRYKDLKLARITPINIEK